jgi:hypothetical protein
MRVLLTSGHQPHDRDYARGLLLRSTDDPNEHRLIEELFKHSGVRHECYDLVKILACITPVPTTKGPILDLDCYRALACFKARITRTIELHAHSLSKDSVLNRGCALYCILSWERSLTTTDATLPITKKQQLKEKMPVKTPRYKAKKALKAIEEAFNQKLPKLTATFEHRDPFEATLEMKPGEAARGAANFDAL